MTYAEAILDLHWQEAMNTELSALQQNNTRTLVPLPDGQKSIECNWV